MNKEDIAKYFEERYNPAEEYLGTGKAVNKIKPLVSVCIMTYQHKDFIARCIEGVLAQKTDFPVEIIIGEDQSTDGTREICIDFAGKFPDKIRLFLRNRETSHLYDENGKFVTRFNAKWNKKAARGKYIAICEGDDYWTNPLKLQKQVSFLEENTDYSLTVGGYEIYNEQDKRRKEIIRILRTPDNESGYTFTREDAGRTWLTKTLTAVYRNEAAKSINYSKYRISIDVHLMYHLLQQGKGFYFTEVFGVYRIHSGGVFSSTSDLEKSVMKYRINKEIYEVNREEIARRMHWRGIKSMLSQPYYSIEVDGNRITKFKLMWEAIFIIKTPREFFSVIRSLSNSVLKIN